MKNLYNKLIISTFAIVAFACSSEDDLTEDWIEANEVVVEVPVSGDLDLSNYVAIGNSLTAGYADNALFPEGQENSFPAILATQFELAGGGETFTNPDIVSGNGNSGGDPASGRLFIDLEVALAALAGDPEASIGDAIVPTAPSPITVSTNTGASLNNFGVPGARVVDIVTAGYGTLNPFFGAFQSAPTTSVIADAASASPSFYSIWIGSNDVLGYASSGGSAGETFDPFNPSTITDQATFSASLSAALDALGTADGVILNVPPVTIIPFFQIVTELSGGINVLPSGSIDAATAAFLNSSAAYGAYNDGLDQMVGLSLITQEEADFRKISFTADVANSPVITDESLTDLSGFGLESIRQAQVDATTGASDLFPLTALDSLGVERVEGNSATTLGVGIPLPDQYSLTMDEQTNVIAAYAGFNAAIAAEADARANVTLVDVGPLFADMFGLSAAQAAGLQLSAAAQAAADEEQGIETGGINLVPLSLSTTELYNSVWSTDGVHPNPRGNALIANEIIAVLNANFNATIPLVNPLEFDPINAPF